MEQLPILRRTLKTEDLPKIFRRAFERELDRNILAQLSEPGRANDHASFNTHYARYFTLLAEKPHLLDGSLESFEDLCAMGLSEDDADALSVLSRTHRHKSPVSAGYLSDDLRAVGVEPSQTNLKVTARLTAAAYREANIAACEDLGMPISPGKIWPLPANLQKLADQVGHDRQSALPPLSSTFLSQSAATVTSELPQHLVDRPTQPAPLPTAPVISEFAKIALDKRIEDGAWDPGRRRDVEAAVAIFIAANGDIPFNAITQDHLIAMKDLFHRLPCEYGRERKDENGVTVRETIVEALMRGDILLSEWKKDRVDADARNLTYVGLSLTTQRKHLTWISSLLTYANGHAPRFAPTGLDMPAVRKTLVQPIAQGERHSIKPGQKKNSKRLPWKADELAKLFDAPIWHGCGGLWHRFQPGNQVIHDANYWVLPLIVSTLARSDEIGGLAVDDVVLDCETPYIEIRPTALRRLKNIASKRKVPISRRILDLGFPAYVAAMKEAGHQALFPEYLHPTMDFEKVFRKDLFDPLRKHFFPNGTSRKRGRKDVDVHSTRTLGLAALAKYFEKTKDPSFNKDHRKALGGHEPGDTTSEFYEDDLQPCDLLPMVEYLVSFIPEIPKRPLNPRPSEFQKFGKPKGRRKTLRCPSSEHLAQLAA